MHSFSTTRTSYLIISPPPCFLSFPRLLRSWGWKVGRTAPAVGEAARQGIKGS
jgi:hypothetical protein